MPNININGVIYEVDYDTDVQMTSNSRNGEKGNIAVGQVQGRTIEQTKSLIKTVLSLADEPMTRGQICKAIDRKNTPHFRNTLAELVRAGEVIEETGVSVSLTMVRYEYSLPR
jgi:hypothetical protein